MLEAAGACGPGMLSFESCRWGEHRKGESEAPSFTSSFSGDFYLQPFSGPVQMQD